MAGPLPTCYLNGQYLPLSEARVSPLDRAFLFADAVYEVMPVYGRRPFRFHAHCDRLGRSLEGLGMRDPLTRPQWHEVFATLIERNATDDTYLYWQVTRGTEYGRNHTPLPDIARTVFAFSAPLPRPTPAQLELGAAAITAADTRWARCDLKTTALLANVLLRQLATDADATETILLRDGVLTEGSSSAVHVVVDGELRSPPQTHAILPGTTRGAVEKMAARAGIPWRATTVTEAELRGASEIILSAAVRETTAVTTLDGRPVGDGRPGPVWHAIHHQLAAYKQELSEKPW